MNHKFTHFMHSNMFSFYWEDTRRWSLERTCYREAHSQLECFLLIISGNSVNTKGQMLWTEAPPILIRRKIETIIIAPHSIGNIADWLNCYRDFTEPMEWSPDCCLRGHSTGIIKVRSLFKMLSVVNVSIYLLLSLEHTPGQWKGPLPKKKKK